MAVKREEPNLRNFGIEPEFFGPAIMEDEGILVSVPILNRMATANPRDEAIVVKVPNLEYMSLLHKATDWREILGHR